MNQPAPPPLPDDPSTAYFWEGTRAGELRILRCRSCGFYVHMPRPVCRNCQSMDLAGEKVSGKATLYAFTETHKAFHPFFVSRVPYLLATVELAEQPHLHFLTNLVGIAEADVRIGMQLEVAFEELSPEIVIPVFRPVAAMAEGSVAS
ncbi:MAG: OB-fold domain-containing protein [Actinomycetota bacterium]|nr:OB-fold domain-containing protein [Actinomycetota bacterium]